MSRGAIGNTRTLFVRLGIMPLAFMMDMYEKDGLSIEKALRNILTPQFLWPDVSLSQTQNIYVPFMGKDKPIAEKKKANASAGDCKAER